MKAEGAMSDPALHIVGPWSETDSAPQWYAVQTRSNFETKVQQSLFTRSVEVFLPKILVMSRRRDRRRKIMRPLIPGYVFVHIDLTPENHLNVVKAAGAVRFVGFNCQPVPIDPEDIRNLEILDGCDQCLGRRPYYKKGERVIILEGPLKGLIGFFKTRKGKSDRLIVSVDLLRRSVDVELNDWAVEKI